MINGSIIGCYKIIEKLGQGGFCQVYKAEQINLGDRLVAIKMLTDECTDDETMTYNYLVPQAETMALLEHPSIVKIYDTFWDKTFCVVMNYVRGRTLATLLDEENLSLKKNFHILRQLAKVIDFIHRANVFHGDINPTNIIIDEKDNINLIGFKKEVPLNTIIGTPIYMAPEQFMSEKIGFGVDIYSFGVVSFELLTGKSPFDECSLTELFNNKTNLFLPSVSEINKSLPKELDHIFKKALSKNPRERYYQAKNFLHELEKAYSSQLEKSSSNLPKIPEEKLIETTSHNKVISHKLAIPCESRLQGEVILEQRVKIKLGWVYQSIPKLRLCHPKEDVEDDFVIVGALKLDDGDYLVLAERIVQEQGQHLVLVKVINKHVLETVSVEVAIKYLARIQEEVLEQRQGISKTLVRSFLGDLPELVSEEEIGQKAVNPIFIRCFNCDEYVEHISPSCFKCGVSRLAPNCPQCNKLVTSWEDKNFLTPLSVYTWNSGWDGCCKHCGLEFDSKLEVQTGHYWFDRGPNSEVKISGNESSTTVLLDYWQHLPIVEITIERLVPGGKLAREEKITLTLEEFQAITTQLQGTLQVLLKRKPWSEDTT